MGLRETDSKERQSLLERNASRKDERIKPVREFTVLALLLEEAQLVRDHELHKTGEHDPLLRLDDLRVDLRRRKRFKS